MSINIAEWYRPAFLHLCHLFYGLKEVTLILWVFVFVAVNSKLP